MNQTRKKQLVHELLLPFLGQFAMVFLCMSVQSLLKKTGKRLIQPPTLLGDVITEPTSGRLAAMLSAFLLFVLLGILASGYGKKGKITLAFWIGLFSGTFLWVCIGENVWHFSANGTNFLRMENVAVLPLVPPALLFGIYVFRNHSLDWGALCVFVSFACNWMGHYVMTGTYGLVSAAVEQQTWTRYSAVIFGALLLAWGLLLWFRWAKEKKERYLASTVVYLAAAIVGFGFVKG